MESDIEALRKKIVDFFDGNEEKATLWFHSRNPMLGNVAPNEMIALGRTDRLIKMAEQFLADNPPK